jgi:hypothetical protein
MLTQSISEANQNPGSQTGANGGRHQATQATSREGKFS